MKTAVAIRGSRKKISKNRGFVIIICNYTFAQLKDYFAKHPTVERRIQTVRPMLDKLPESRIWGWKVLEVLPEMGITINISAIISDFVSCQMWVMLPLPGTLSPLIPPPLTDTVMRGAEGPERPFSILTDFRVEGFPRG